MKKKFKYLVFLFLLLFFYYQIDYKRYYIYSDDKTKCFTIWKRYGHHSYIIPGKYSSPFKPTSNYIYIRNQYIGVIFNTFDEYNYKLGIFPKKVSDDFDKKIRIFENNDSLLINYRILKIKNKDIRIYAENQKDLKKKYDYKLISLKTIYGINVLDGE